MEWTAKWDWENIGGYASKAIQSPKKMQLAADWVIVDDGDIHAGSFNLSGNGSSSISASTDSGMRTPNYTIDGSCPNFTNTIEIKGMGFSTTSPPPDSSVGSSEALLGLKLGKRTYFENSGVGVGVGGGTVMPTTPSTSTIIMKKTKSSSAPNAPPPPPPICCQVEGCNIDLSKAKEYHRKHRVCETHSKCPRVIVGGRDRRFCQQCSRFHSLTEFDEKKRSCRRRLSDHNARRRKPQQETIHFDPATHTHTHSTPYYGGNQEMSFVLNNSAFRTPGNCGWDSACNTSKFTLTQGQGYSNDDQQLHIKPPQGIINMQNSANRLKNSTSLVSNPAAAAPEVGRALSLLSTNSWDSCEPESIPLHHQTILQPPIIHAGVPLSSSSDFWLSHPHIPTNANFQEIQLFKTPYDANFYSNVLN